MRITLEETIHDPATQGRRIPGPRVGAFRRPEKLPPEPVASLGRPQCPEPASGVHQHGPENFVPGNLGHVAGLVDHNPVGRVTAGVIGVIERAIDNPTTRWEIRGHGRLIEPGNPGDRPPRLRPGDADLIEGRAAPDDRPAGQDRLFDRQRHRQRRLPPAPAGREPVEPAGFLADLLLTHVGEGKPDMLAHDSGSGNVSGSVSGAAPNERQLLTYSITSFPV
jgi:hypothetical protein